MTVPDQLVISYLITTHDLIALVDREHQRRRALRRNVAFTLILAVAAAVFGLRQN